MGGTDLSDHFELREGAKVKAKNPVMILTSQNMIQGKARRITKTGIFLTCKEKLPKNETYTMAIRLSEKEAVVIKGELLWSNRDNFRKDNSLPETGISFIRILDEDRHLFTHKVIHRLEAQKGSGITEDR